MSAAVDAVRYAGKGYAAKILLTSLVMVSSFIMIWLQFGVGGALWRIVSVLASRATGF